MCGIGGCVLGRGAGPDQDRLVAMRDALAHRGPDDSGIQVIDNVGLVHTRLSIVDLSERGHQPMEHPAAMVDCLQRRDLQPSATLRRSSSSKARSLGRQRHRDPAVGARAVGPGHRLGERSIRFRRPRPARGRVLLCRDRFGVKPLYLARFAGGVWWAGEPAALVAAGAPAEPVETAWADLWPAPTSAASDAAGGHHAPSPGSWAEISLEDAEIKT